MRQCTNRSKRAESSACFSGALPQTDASSGLHEERVRNCHSLSMKDSVRIIVLLGWLAFCPGPSQAASVFANGLFNTSLSSAELLVHEPELNEYGYWSP